MFCFKMLAGCPFHHSSDSAIIYSLHMCRDSDCEIYNVMFSIPVVVALQGLWGIIGTLKTNQKLFVLTKINHSHQNIFVFS